MIYPIVTPVFIDLPLEIPAEVRRVQHRIQNVNVIAHFLDDLTFPYQRMPHGKTENADTDLYAVTKTLLHFLQKCKERLPARSGNAGQGDTTEVTIGREPYIIVGDRPYPQTNDLLGNCIQIIPDFLFIRVSPRDSLAILPDSAAVVQYTITCAPGKVIIAETDNACGYLYVMCDCLTDYMIDIQVAFHGTKIFRSF